MERVLPEVARTGIEKMIEYAHSFEPYFAPTVVLGEYELLQGRQRGINFIMSWTKMTLIT